MQKRCRLLVSALLPILWGTPAAAADDEPERLTFCNGPNPIAVVAEQDTQAAVLLVLPADACELRLERAVFEGAKERLRTENHLWLPVTMSERGAGFVRVPDIHLIRWTIHVPGAAAIRAEAVALVEGIRAAELARFVKQGSHLGVGMAVPRHHSSLDGTAMPWPSGTDFDELGWAPSGPVHCSFRVTVVRDDFTVQGVCDLDEDGYAARITASRELPAQLATPENVW
jgi:hypothetical protein